MSAGKISPLKWTAFLAVLIVIFMPSYLPAANAFAAVQAAVDPPNVARISDVAENTFVLGKGDVDWSYAEANLVVEQGDLLQTDETGRVEIQFQDDITFRIGENSRIAVLEVGDSKVIGMDGGRGYIRVGEQMQRNNKLQLTFPTGQLTAEQPALARIDVRDDKSVEIRVFRGVVGVESISEGAREIDARKVVMIKPDGSMDISSSNLARADAFDKWNEERDIALSTYRRPEYVQQNITGVQDLNGYGRWVYMDRYNNYGWQPYVVQTWRPYYYGHWSYSSAYGWMWVPEEPWGYVTYHYGSWNYDPNYGWVWIPGYVWRPSHVYWISYDDYAGWVPLDYYGYPVITTYPYHVTSYYPGYIDFFSFTFVHYRYFPYYDHHYYYHHDDDRDHDHDGDRDHDHDHDRDHDHDGDRDHDHDRDRDHGHDGDIDHGHGGDVDHGIDHGHYRDGDDRHVAGANGEFHDDDAKLHDSYNKLREDYQRFKENYKSPAGKSFQQGPANGNNRIVAGAPSNPKVAFVKNLDEKGLAKPLRKGRVIQQTDFTKYLDAKNHPEMAKKITRLTQQAQIKQPAGTTAAFPSDPGKDRVKALDFRRQMQEKQNRTIKSQMKMQPAAPVQPGQQQTAPVRTPSQTGIEQKNQKMTPAPTMRDMQRQPSAPGQIQKSMQPQRETTDSPEARKQPAQTPGLTKQTPAIERKTVRGIAAPTVAAGNDEQKAEKTIRQTFPSDKYNRLLEQNNIVFDKMPKRQVQNPAVNIPQPPTQRQEALAAARERFMKVQEIQDVKRTIPAPQRVSQSPVNTQRPNSAAADSKRYGSPSMNSQKTNQPAANSQRNNQPAGDSQRYYGPAVNSQRNNPPPTSQQRYNSPVFDQQRYSTPVVRQGNRQVAPQATVPSRASVPDRAMPSRSYEMRMPVQPNAAQPMNEALLQRRQPSRIEATPYPQSDSSSQRGQRYSAPNYQRGTYQQRESGNAHQSSSQGQSMGRGGRH